MKTTRKRRWWQFGLRGLSGRAPRTPTEDQLKVLKGGLHLELDDDSP
jgi:hypothetical protein